MSVTPANRLRLEAELERLETADLPAAERAVSEAQGVGDIAENNDVAIAVADRARVRNRIRQIEHALGSGDDEDDAPEGVVSAGRLVTLRFDAEDPETYLFGHVEDRHPDYTTLTENSPVGSAVKGASAGDALELTLGGVTQTIEVLSVVPAE